MLIFRTANFIHLFFPMKDAKKAEKEAIIARQIIGRQKLRDQARAQTELDEMAKEKGEEKKSSKREGSLKKVNEKLSIKLLKQ